MNFIEELKTRKDLVKDPENIISTGERITVFERVHKEIAEGELGRQLDEARARQARGWARYWNCVVGCEYVLDL